MVNTTVPGFPSHQQALKNCVCEHAANSSWAQPLSLGGRTQPGPLCIRHPCPVAHSPVIHTKAKTSAGHLLGYKKKKKKKLQSQRNSSEQDPQLRVQVQRGPAVLRAPAEEVLQRFKNCERPTKCFCN